MSRTKNIPFSKVAMLSLALSVSTSCAQIASAAPQVAETFKSSTAAKAEERAELEGKKRLRKVIKSTISKLNEMSSSLQQALAVLGGSHDFPRQLLEENPYPETIASLRELAEILPGDHQIVSLPIIGDEYLQLRRKIATTRSLAVRAQVLIDQRLSTPEVYFESEVEGEGLKALAGMATDRLNRLAS